MEFSREELIIREFTESVFLSHTTYNKMTGDVTIEVASNKFQQCPVYIEYNEEYSIPVPGCKTIEDLDHLIRLFS